MAKTVLVTGGSGYLGSHLCKELKRSGFNVVVYDKKIPHHQYCDLYCPGDIRKKSQLVDLFTRVKISAVYHLAGRIEVGESVKYPTEFYDVNVAGTCNLLNVMSLFKVDKIIYSSTAGVYKPDEKPLSETSEIAHNNPYSISKYLSEIAIKNSGMEYVIFRYFNLAGADEDGEMGEEHDPETHLIPNMIRNDEFELYGTDYDTPDGTCIRDFVHVSDVASAHVSAYHYLDFNKDSAIFNLGTGNGHSILDIIKVVESISDEKVDYNLMPRRIGDPSRLVADISLAQKELNYRPRHDIMSIVETAYNWHKKND